MTNKRKQLKQIQNQSQSGRSMVEMLGVLAIIGVLSIGGIAGYRMAMNHYQANQIAHEINMMRTDAKVKIAQGMTKLLLGSPYDGDGHLNFNANYGVQVDFPVTITDEEGEEDGYSFTLSGIPAGVCKPLATLLDGMDDAAALEINGNENNECDDAAESNTITVFFDTDTTTAVGDCSGHGELKYYSGGDPSEKGSFCYCEDGYTGERCEKQGENKECTSNTDCGTGQYCYFKVSSVCREQTAKGKCKSNTPDAQVVANSKKFFVKMDWMNWWSAENFCASIGKPMASISDLQCSSESEAQIKSNGYGDCYKAGTSGDISETIKELYKKIGEHYWLSGFYDNSCYAYGVLLSSGGVCGNPRHNHLYRYALCVAPKTE